MYNKQMSAEQAVAYVSSCDRNKLIYEKSDKLGIPRYLIMCRMFKGKTGDELLVPKKPKYVHYHNGVPLKKLLDNSSYNAYFRYLSANGGDREQAFAKATRKKEGKF